MSLIFRVCWFATGFHLSTKDWMGVLHGLRSGIVEE